MRALVANLAGYLTACLIFSLVLPPGWAVLATVALTVVAGGVILLGGCFLGARRMRYQFLAGLEQDRRAELVGQRSIDP